MKNYLLLLFVFPFLLVAGTAAAAANLIDASAFQIRDSLGSCIFDATTPATSSLYADSHAVWIADPSSECILQAPLSQLSTSATLSSLKAYVSDNSSCSIKAELRKTLISDTYGPTEEAVVVVGATSSGAGNQTLTFLPVVVAGATSIGAEKQTLTFSPVGVGGRTTATVPLASNYLWYLQITMSANTSSTSFCTFEGVYVGY